MRRAIIEQQREIEEQRKQLTVQSLFQIWQSHIQTCHLPIATGEDEIAQALNKMTPYHAEKIEDARKYHFADAVLDLYECINLVGQLGIVDSEVTRIWADSVPYELKNPNLREHWRRNHRPMPEAGTPTSEFDIYHGYFSELVEKYIAVHEHAREEN